MFAGKTAPCLQNRVLPNESKPRKGFFMKIIKVIGLVCFLWIGYMGYLWVASANEIKRVCGHIKAGQSIQEVKDRIQAGKYLLHFENRSEPNVVHGITIYSRECYGKVSCSVDFDGEVVARTELKGS